jgi:predicted ATP-grasp superfamily ATP-dependent carboligase
MAPAPEGAAPVLVLDADQRSALATIRSLGRRGVPVVAGDECLPSLGGTSRYCARAFRYPPPHSEPAAFLEALRREVEARGCGMVLPMTDVTTTLVSEARDTLGAGRIPLAGRAALDALADKWALYRLARQHGLPAPRTERVAVADLRRGQTGGVSLPCVLKPVRSRSFDGVEWVRGGIHYVAEPADIARALAADRCLTTVPYLAQEYVAGWGQGVFALFDRGKPVTYFAHRRIREKPPSGGMSVLCESVPLDARLLAVTEALLTAVAWHGVAMVEFRVSPAGPFLLEVNTRFWGSLQLAVDAGVDFPWMLYQMTSGLPVDVPQTYAARIRSRWLLGDADTLYLTLRDSRSRAERWRALWDFLRPGPCPTRHEVNRWEDLGPFFHEIRRYRRAVVRGCMSRALRLVRRARHA